MTVIANNTKELRLQLLLTPKQLADRLGVTTKRLRALEQPDKPLPEGWPEAIAHALGVPASTVTHPNPDLQKVGLESTAQAAERRVCRIAARFAILAMVAKLGGLSVASELSEPDLDLALQSLLLYTENPPNAGSPDKKTKKDGEAEKDELNRLSQSLQITVLAILQSRGVEPETDLLREMEIARDGALSLIETFSNAGSNADRPPPVRETK